MTKSEASALPSPGLLAFLTSRPYLLLVLAPLFWGGNIVAGKMAVGNADPYVLLVGRWTGAILICIVIGSRYMREDWRAVRASLPLLFFYGALGFATFNILMYGAAYFTAAVNASIEQAVIPVFVLIGNFLIFRVRAKPLQIAGLLLTIAGVVWVATHGNPARLLALDVNIGDGMVLAACLLYAAYSVALRFKPNIHWLTFMLVTAAAALVTSLAYQLLFDGGFGVLASHIPETTLIGWICILYVMTFPSIVAQLCYARGVQLIGANRASLFINLLPVFGTILSVLIVGEGLEGYHVVAAVLVIGGIVLAEWAARSTIVR